MRRLYSKDIVAVIIVEYIWWKSDTQIGQHKFSRPQCICKQETMTGVQVFKIMRVVRIGQTVEPVDVTGVED